MSQKRIRSINWDEEEKQLFCMVFKEYAQIIENKSLDTNTNTTKTKAWEQVHTKFNQLNGRPRDLKQLKIQWKTMKVNARKSYSAYKKETNKTGGGTRPPTPNDTIMEIKDLLNPAELLRDYNSYDSDGVVVGKMEIQTTSDTCNTQNPKLTLLVNNSNIEEDLITNIACIETVEVDDQVSCQKFNPVISPLIATPATPIAIKMDSILGKTTEDKDKVTPIINRGTTKAKKVAKRKINLNNIINSDKNSRKDHEGYVNSMMSHSKMLKDEEHIRRMEMAEEEHAIKMEIHRENLKSAILQRKILELTERDLL